MDSYQKVVSNKNVYGKRYQPTGLLYKVRSMQYKKKVIIILIQLWPLNNAETVFYIQGMKIKIIPQKLHIFLAGIFYINPDKILSVVYKGGDTLKVNFFQYFFLVLIVYKSPYGENLL